MKVTNFDQTLKIKWSLTTIRKLRRLRARAAFFEIGRLLNNYIIPIGKIHEALTICRLVLRGKNLHIPYNRDFALKDQRSFLQRNGNYSPFCFLLATRAQASDNRVGPETRTTVVTVRGGVKMHKLLSLKFFYNCRVKLPVDNKFC